MIFNPHTYDPSAYDPETQRQLKALIQFFEDKGLAQMKQEFHDRSWYQDFLDFNAKEGILAAFGTPASVGEKVPGGTPPGSTTSTRSSASTRCPTGTPGRSPSSAWARCG